MFSTSMWESVTTLYVQAGVALNRYVPAGTTTVLALVEAPASWMAARKVHTPPPEEVAQIPSPGFASTMSAVLFTVNVAEMDGATHSTNNMRRAASLDTMPLETAQSVRISLLMLSPVYPLDDLPKTAPPLKFYFCFFRQQLAFFCSVLPEPLIFLCATKIM